MENPYWQFFCGEAHLQTELPIGPVIARSPALKHAGQPSYDGHTLAEALEQVGVLTGTDKPPATAIVDKGYRGVKVEGVLKGSLGDALHAVMCGAGHNLRLILAALRLFAPDSAFRSSR